MITEDYVSFETAKLLKEKGFDEECSCFYNNIDYGTPGLEVDGQLYYKNSALDDEEDAAPTLQMAMKWLREVHRRIISPKYNEVKDERGLLYSMWFFDILPISKTLPIIEYNQSYDTYEEACEAAIKYCLENLI